MTIGGLILGLIGAALAIFVLVGIVLATVIMAKEVRRLTRR